MYTRLEEELYTLAKSFFANSLKIDWEKRRYELVRDIYSRNAENMSIDDAIDKADEIINKLKTKK